MHEKISGISDLEKNRKSPYPHELGDSVLWSEVTLFS
jgi:hypothetical protein